MNYFLYGKFNFPHIFERGNAGSLKTLLLLMAQRWNGTAEL